MILPSAYAIIHYHLRSYPSDSTNYSKNSALAVYPRMGTCSAVKIHRSCVSPTFISVFSAPLWLILSLHFKDTE